MNAAAVSALVATLVALWGLCFAYVLGKDAGAQEILCQWRRSCGLMEELSWEEWQAWKREHLTPPKDGGSR